MSDYQDINKTIFRRLVVLRGMLKLETKGMTRRGRSAYSIIKQEFNLRGNKQSVYTQFCEYVEKQRGVLMITS